MQVGATAFDVEGSTVQSSTTVDGVGVIVDPAGVTVTGKTPATALRSGNTVHGSQLNPSVDETQGYDAQSSAIDSSYSPAKTASFPLAMQPGDVLMSAVSETAAAFTLNGDFRDGVLTDQCPLIVVPTAPTATHDLFAPAIISHTGRGPITAADFWDIDTAGFVAGIPTFDGSVMTTPPDKAFVLEAVRRVNVLYAQRGGTNVTGGYQQFMARYLAGIGVSNYGQHLAGLLSDAAVLLLSDLCTPAERRDIAIGLISWGIQWLDPLVGAGATVGANGAHNQFGALPAFLAQVARGLDPVVVMAHLPGNIVQAFQWTQGLIDSNLVAHNDDDKPAAYRWRTVTNVSGNDITIDTSGWPTSKCRFDGFPLIRADGATATVLLPDSNTSIGGQTVVTINQQPSGYPAFAPGDQVYFGAHPNLPIAAGDCDWLVGKAGQIPAPASETYHARPETDYRGLQMFSGAAMLMRAIPAIASLSELGPFFGYVARCNTPGGPFNTQHSSVAVEEFWNAHWSTIQGG